jgi:Glutaredoxin and related proteins
MKIVRALLKPLILGLDRLTAPNPPVRDAQSQAALDSRTRNLVLYHLEACPFCVKVRRQIRRQGLKIAMKDIAREAEAGKELVQGGKLDQVPCLRIDRGSRVEWLYESDAINGYLKTNFDQG